MPLEALISFLLLFHLRRTVKTFSPDVRWEQWLRQAMIATGVFLAVSFVKPLEPVTRWCWFPWLAWIIWLPFREPVFAPTRMTMFAVMPLAAISFLSQLLAAVFPSLRVDINHYEAFAYPVAVTWLIALLILSRRQVKALKEEHRKRLEEEEQHRQIALRKAELETMVAERTAELQQQKEELQQTLKELKSTQAQLIQREKMASLGDLTAGVAHEIKNPLNFVNNFSELNLELATELQEQIARLPIAAAERDELLQLLCDVTENQKKIHHHGLRADGIVKAMLQHSRTSAHEKESTDLNALVEEYLRLSYHGIRAKDKLFTAIIESHLDPAVGEISINAQDIGRVLLNVFNNAFYAVHEKKKMATDDYEPLVQVRTKKRNGAVEISISDNGPGIPEALLPKIYQPFFTTKPTGEGAGLGLSLSYDIVTKAHGGEIRAETKEGDGAAFRIQLPVD